MTITFDHVIVMASAAAGAGAEHELSLLESELTQELEHCLTHLEAESKSRLMQNGLDSQWCNA